MSFRLLFNMWLIRISISSFDFTGFSLGFMKVLRFGLRVKSSAGL